MLDQDTQQWLERWRLVIERMTNSTITLGRGPLPEPKAVRTIRIIVPAHHAHIQGGPHATD